MAAPAIRPRPAGAQVVRIAGRVWGGGPCAGVFQLHTQRSRVSGASASRLTPGCATRHITISVLCLSYKEDQCCEHSDFPSVSRPDLMHFSFIHLLIHSRVHCTPAVCQASAQAWDACVSLGRQPIRGSARERPPALSWGAGKVAWRR